MKTILTREYQKERIYHSLARKTGSVTDVQLLSVSNLLKADTREDKETTLLQLSHTLNANAAQYPIYSGMFQYPAFLEEILSFARACAQWEITSYDLPGRTASETELKQLLEAAMSLPLEEAEIQKHYSSLLNQAASLPELSIAETFEPDPYRNQFLNDLKENRPDAVLKPQELKPVIHTLRYALNTRQEIEACAQDIIEEDQPCTVVLADYSNQLPVLKQIFARYGIPFSPIEEPLSVQVPYLYASLALFALYKDADHLLTVLKNDGLNPSCPDPLMPFLSECMIEPDAPSNLATRVHDEQFERESARLLKLEQSAHDYFEATDEDRQLLASSATAKEALANAYTVLQHSPFLKEPAELKTASRLRQILNRSLNLVETETDALFLIRSILALKVSAAGSLNLFCTVTDLTHPVPVTETLYVLGCSARCYPGVPSRKGLFDEDYVSRIRNYPSLQQRHDDYISHIGWITRSSRRIVYSYPTNDYQGRSIQPSFDVTSLFDKESSWPIAVLTPKPPFAHALRKDLAAQLYPADDGKIHSSISSVERWFLCPYSYFLQSGLSIRPFPTPDLEAAVIGTIQHALMSHLVDTYGKAYAEVSRTEVQAFLDPYFHQLSVIHPHETVRIQLSEERMIRGMMESLTILRDVEKTTIFKPNATEQHFEYEIIPGIQLHGIIDRIDHSNGTFRILDYKSSAHRLSETKIKAGEMLQLLSYAMAYANSSSLKPAGTYYFNLQAPSVNDPAADVKTTSFEEAQNVFEADHLRELQQKQRRLSGWAYEMPDDAPEDYVQYFEPNKQYVFEQVSRCIESLYQVFKEGLMDGTISADPADTACTYCQFRSICRNRAPARKADSMVVTESFDSSSIASRKSKKEDA